MSYHPPLQMAYGADESHLFAARQQAHERSGGRFSTLESAGRFDYRMHTGKIICDTCIEPFTPLPHGSAKRKTAVEPVRPAELAVNIRCFETHRSGIYGAFGFRQDSRRQASFSHFPR